MTEPTPGPERLGGMSEEDTLKYDRHYYGGGWYGMHPRPDSPMTDQTPGTEPTLAALLDQLVEATEGFCFDDTDIFSAKIDAIRAVILARFGGKREMMTQSQSEALYTLTLLNEFHEGRNALAQTETEAAAKEEREDYG